MNEGDADSYETVIERSPVPMWIQGVEEIRFANEAAAAFFHVDGVDSLVGTSALEFVPADGRQRVRERNRELLAGEESVATLEGTTGTADGERKHGHYVAYPVRYRGEDALVVTAHDATARHEYQQQLQRQNERLGALFENTTEAVVEYEIEDGEPIARSVNGRFETVFGYDAETVVGRSVDDLIVPDDREQEAASLNEKVRREEFFSAEVERAAADGLRSFLLRVAPIDTDEGTRGYAIYTDISDRKRYERRLEARTEQLEMLNRLLRHDINNDMNVVIGRTELAREQTDDETVAGHLEKALTASQNVVELTRSARDLMQAMLSEDRERKPVRLSPVLESEVDDIRDDGVFVEFDGPVPTVQVLADELLGSVFRNILQNAVEHTDKPTVHITVAVEVDEESVRVAIADDGPGIPDERKETIFGRNEKGLDSEGTGIGLYLVASVVGGYGGDVSVVDRADHPLGEDGDTGSVFTVELERA